MKEKIIVKNIPVSEWIHVNDVSRSFCRSGVIIVYDHEEKIVGSVIYYGGDYFLGINNDTLKFNCLETILDNYPAFTFKYLY